MKQKLLNYMVKLMICTLFICTFGSATKAQERVVRVGYFSFDNYYEVDEKQNKSGYGYDYLQEIAKYAPWQLEYVYGSWDELLNMLATGEIDLLDLADKTPQREKIYDFSTHESGYTQARLLTLSNEQYAYEDFENFTNMRVGVLQGNAKNASFDTYKQEHGFQTVDIPYASCDEMYLALFNHEVDAILMSSIYESNQLKMIAVFDTAPYYYMTTKGNNELLEELDNAMYQVNNHSPQLSEQLYQKHFNSDGLEYTAFTKEELEYIKQSEKVTIALAESRSVLSNFSNGEFGGISYSLMELISEKSGIDFEYVVLPKGVRAIEFLDENKADVIVPIMESAMAVVSNQLELVQTDLPSELVFVGRIGEDFKNEDQPRIVLPKSFFNAEEQLLTLYPNAKISYLDSNLDCFKAVSSKHADLTLENRYVAYNNLRSPRLENLEIINSHAVQETFSLALRQSERALLHSILKKTVASISVHEYNEIIQSNTIGATYRMTLADFVYKFRLALILLCILVGTLIAFILYKQTNYLKLKNTNKKLVDALKQKETATNEVAKLEAQRIADMRYQEELRKMLEQDTLTGILNKQGFYNQARDVLAHNPDKQYIIVQWDLNRFKMFNDKFGIEAGDKLLVDLAQVLHSLDNEHSLCARLQADHFVELYDVKKFSIARYMERMKKWSAEYPAKFEITFCVGVYIVDDPSVDIGIMCDRALLALYKTKGTFGNNYAFYDDEIRKRILAEQDIVNDMVYALENNEFEVYFQPQYSYSDMKLIGAEALVRWNHHEKGLISPGEFIPIFEKNGFIMQLDRYIWEKACQCLAEWKKPESGFDPVSISVNISRSDIYNSDLCEVFSKLIKKYDLSPSDLKLEITESAYVEAPEHLINTVCMLQKLGFILEMDDFGSGYSSLNTLKDVPVDVLKLDMRFLNKSNSSRGGNILNSIIRMAKWLDLRVIAEGVETRENADFLSSIGCDYMQGYFFARPMKQADFEEVMKKEVCSDISLNESVTNFTILEELWKADSKTAIMFNRMLGPVAIVERRGNEVEVVRFSDKFYKILNYGVEEFEEKRRNILNCVSEDTKAIFIESLNIACENHHQVKREVCFESENLNENWLQVYSYFLTENDNNSQLYFIHLKDVNEMHALKEELKQLKKEC